MHFSRHLSVQEISTTTGLDARRIRDVLKLYRETGSVTPHNKKVPRKRALDNNDLDYINASIAHSPDMYLDELKQQLEDICGVRVSLSTIWSELKRKGFTLKKISKAALERSETKRMQYIYRMGHKYTPDQLVFVDESSFDRRTCYRGYAWALRGRRALRKCFFVRGKRYSILPAISLNGILSCHIVEGSFNTGRFTEFIEGLLDQMQPYPAPNSVIVMDNCQIHKAPEIVEMIEARGMKVEFLPAYSPDFNPIEQAFSVIKSYIRRHYRHFAQSDTTGTDPADKAEVYIMLYKAVFSITSDNAAGFYHHSGYT